VVFIF
jgi:hypothetical protein